MKPREHFIIRHIKRRAAGSTRRQGNKSGVTGREFTHEINRQKGCRFKSGPRLAQRAKLKGELRIGITRPAFGRQVGEIAAGVLHLAARKCSARGRGRSLDGQIPIGQERCKPGCFPREPSRMQGLKLQAKY